MNYEQKYLKYKQKYLLLKKLYGGVKETYEQLYRMVCDFVKDDVGTISEIKNYKKKIRTNDTELKKIDILFEQAKNYSSNIKLFDKNLFDQTVKEFRLNYDIDKKKIIWESKINTPSAKSSVKSNVNSSVKSSVNSSVNSSGKKILDIDTYNNLIIVNLSIKLTPLIKGYYDKLTFIDKMDSDLLVDLMKQFNPTISESIEKFEQTLTQYESSYLDKNIFPVDIIFFRIIINYIIDEMMNELKIIKIIKNKIKYYSFN